MTTYPAFFVSGHPKPKGFNLCRIDGKHQNKACGHWKRGPHTDAHRAKISATLTGRKLPADKLERKNATLRAPEIREKMSAAMQQSEAHKKVVSSELFRQKQSNATTKRRAAGWGNTRSTGKMGFRSDIGVYVRSSWEANYARFLNYLLSQGSIIKWEYEPERFEFPDIKRGTRSYLPDFKITNLDGTIEYHEVKGYWTSKGRTAVRRFRARYPSLKLIVIEGKEYKELEKRVRLLIPAWEV